MARVISNGDLRTPITFFSFKPVSGPDPDEEQKEILHYCFCEIYTASQKDLEILSTTDYTESIALNIRDPLMDYIVENTHFAELDHFRYAGKVWNIVDVRPDAQANGFINILLGRK